MELEKIKAYVTKYALTKGIQLVDGDVYRANGREVLTWGIYGQAVGKDWHRTPEAALARAEEMRKDRIVSLSISMTKMEKLKFTVPT